MSEKSKGRILRIKRGYNPNSSSVGSDIPTFLFSGAALVLLSGIATQIHSIIADHFKGNGKNVLSRKQEKNER